MTEPLDVGPSVADGEPPGRAAPLDAMRAPIAAGGMGAAPPGTAETWSRAAQRSLVAVLLAVIAMEFIVAILHPLGAFRNWGGDYSLYMEATRRWLDGGSFYQPWQLTGSYDVNFLPGDRGSTAVLYPPATLALFVPFAILPAVLWWAVPIALTLYVLWRERPTGWAWVGILAGIASPSSWFIVANGNPALWVVAFIAAGVIWRWPSVLVLLKFTLAPFALVGIRSRGWWVGLAGLLIVSFVLLPLTLEYVDVLLNMRGQDWTYSLASFPMMMIPLWARAGLRR